MTPEEITRAGVLAIAAAVRKRTVTASEVTEAFLARADAVEPRLNTYAARLDASARAEAAEVDRLLSNGHDPGSLAGVPVTVKDLIAVRDAPFRSGSLLRADHVSEADAPSVARLRQAGAVILGKTTTSEFGGKAVGDSPLTGITRNPWNPALTPGGSSAGAAAGVAAGLAPVALGTDGGGSIRIPASFCGLFGMKAQFGRVPVWPPSATPSLAHVGVIARNAADAMAVLRVIEGFDPRDPASAPVLPLDVPTVGSDLSGLRIGWCPDLGYGGARPDIGVACRAVLEALARRDGVTIVPVQPWLERDPGYLWASEFYTNIASHLSPRHEDQVRLDPELLREVRARTGQDARIFLHAGRARTEVRARLAAVFEKVDFLASPATPVTAFPVGLSRPPGFEAAGPVTWSRFTYPFNLTGNPAVSLPVGLDGDGLPIGLQLVAPPFGEARLLGAAMGVEEIARFRHRAPDFA